MINLTLIKRIELAMATDTSGPMAVDYIPPCPTADESNCRASDLMDSGKAAKYKALVIPSDQWFDLKMDITDFAFNAFYFESGNKENPYVEADNGDLIFTSAAQARFNDWYDAAESMLINHDIDCVETGADS